MSSEPNSSSIPESILRNAETITIIFCRLNDCWVAELEPGGEFPLDPEASDLSWLLDAVPYACRTLLQPLGLTENDFDRHLTCGVEEHATWNRRSGNTGSNADCNNGWHPGME